MVEVNGIELRKIDTEMAFTEEEEGKRIIYIHKNLKHWPRLYNRVLRHELLHTSTGSDFKQDLKAACENAFDADVYAFFLSNPKAMLSALPLTLRKDEKNTYLYINWFLFGFYVVLVGLLVGLFSLL